VRLFWHQLRWEQVVFWRSREAAVFVFLFPLLLFALLTAVFNGTLYGRPDAHDPPLAQHCDTVGQLLGLVEVMRGEEDGLAERPQRPDHLPRRPPRRRIEARGRLVEEDEVGVADQRDAEVEPALLAARQGLHPCLRLLLETDERDHLVDVPRRAVVTGEDRVDLTHGEVRPELRGLEDDDARFSPMCERIFGSVGLTGAESYYDLAKGQGLDLARFYKTSDIGTDDEEMIFCPYCYEQIEEDTVICPACQRDTTRDAKVELTSAGLASMGQASCVSCGRQIVALATICRICRTRQRGVGLEPPS